MVSYKTIKYTEYLDQMLPQLPNGAFLTVKDDDGVNPMVIGWGTIGYLWGKPVFTVYVRYTRYTFKLLDKMREFTISVPLMKKLNKQLEFCGLKSGKDIDKVKEIGLTTLPGRTVTTPIIADCELHYECKVIYEANLSHRTMEASVRNRYYKDNNYHVVYYGEIVDSYIINQ